MTGPKEILDFLIASAAVGGLIYRIAKLEAAIYKSIDLAIAEGRERVKEIEKRLEIHLENYHNKNDLVTLLINQLDQKIDHKFKRVRFAQKDMQRYLGRSGFTPRDFFDGDSDSDSLE